MVGCVLLSLGFIIHQATNLILIGLLFILSCITGACHVVLPRGYFCVFWHHCDTNAFSKRKQCYSLIPAVNIYVTFTSTWWFIPFIYPVVHTKNARKLATFWHKTIHCARHPVSVLMPSVEECSYQQIWLVIRMLWL